MAHEVELKLELAPGDAASLADSVFLAGKSTTARLKSIYFDTPDLALADKGMSLRIRRAGRMWVQTVKASAGSATGLFVRNEWERELTGDRPVPDDVPPVRRVLGAKFDTIIPFFEVCVARRTWNFDGEDAVVELVLDRGEIIAADRRSELCEVELELKDGSPARLFALAREIGSLAPVRIGVLSKAERGYRLLGAAQSAIKAEPVRLKAAMAVDAALERIVEACLRHFRLNETLLLGRRDPEVLHQTRVALRRLRSAFSIFKPMLQGDSFDRLRREFRWLIGELGDARNLDVLVVRARPGTVRTAIEQARDAAYRRAEGALGSPRERALMLDLVEWLSIGDWRTQPACYAMRDRPTKAFAESALDRLRKQVKKRGRRLTDLDDACRHRLRIAAKKMRYAAEFFAPLYDRRHERRRYSQFIDALKILQDGLGELNDLAVAPDLLERIGLANEPEAARLLDADRAKLLSAAADAYEDFADAKPFWR